MLEFGLAKEVSRNSNILKTVTLDPQTLRRYLLRRKIAMISELKQALGSTADLTVFRKLKSLDYLSSYTHRGSYYTLSEIASFDDSGLWSHQGVWFSRYGTLLQTAEEFVQHSPQGFLAHELADALHVEVHDALRQLSENGRLRRVEFGKLYLYTALDFHTHRHQLRMRETSAIAPVAADAGALQVSPHELQATIILFYSLLDEQQRRLYAGLESIRLGRGGDIVIADFLSLDPHTVARGRQQLLDQDVAPPGRARRLGGGRTGTEKKRRK